MQSCNICDLSSDIVGALETMHAKDTQAGQTVTKSVFVCSFCKQHYQAPPETKE